MAKVIGQYKEFEWQDEKETLEDYDARTDVIFNQMQEQADSLPKDVMRGRIVRFPIADGYAYYQVWREKPLELIHIPIGDAWQIPPAHAKGLTLSDIRQQVRCEQAMRELFSKKKKVG